MIASGPIGASVCVQIGLQQKVVSTWDRSLPLGSSATNQKAELNAMIIALEQAVEKADEMDSIPRMHVTIYSDSKYVVDCMTTSRARYRNRDYTSAKGRGIQNRDLMQEAHNFQEVLEGLGEVRIIWIPRDQNQRAEKEADKVLDEIVQSILSG